MDVTTTGQSLISASWGHAGISIFDAEARSLRYQLDMVERHPEGSQAFLTAPGQAINLHRGNWHGVLTPLNAPGLFAVVDRIGDTHNLEEYWSETQYVVRS